MWDHVIKNGTLVTGTEELKADIYIKDGKIEAVSAEPLEGDAKEITDAEGLFVFPGFIDAHVHSRDGRQGPHYKEDFFHSTMAGACGGITTLYEMPTCVPAIYNKEMLKDFLEVATPKAHIDFGVWGICLGDLNDSELAGLDEAGVIGFKYFWGYAIDSNTYQLVYNYEEGMEGIIPPLDDGEVYRIFRTVAKTGKPVGIHAENFFIIKTMTEEVKKTGDASYEALLKGRPDFAEAMVIETAIRIAEATGVHLHIHHVSSKKGAEVIRAAKARGVNITAETCSQYLYLTNKDAERAGTLMKCYPLVRTQEDQDALWDAVRDGTINYVASDHAPHSLEEKNRDMWSALAGITGIETLPLILVDAVNKGKISKNDLARLLSEEPAKIFGTYPMKGSLDIGTDADLTIVAFDVVQTFSQEQMHSKNKLSPYNGRQFQGKVVKTILRGRTIADNGEIIGGPSGKFITALGSI